jgi:hypothetical protein
MSSREAKFHRAAMVPMDSVGTVRVVNLGDSPELAEAVYDFPSVWPAFMVKDPISDLYYNDVTSTYPEYVMLALDGDQVVARSFSVPFAWDGDPATDLPAGGWDWVIQQSCLTRFSGSKPTIVSAVEIAVKVERRGTGLAAQMLDAMRSNIARLGFRDLVAPVRPNGKPSFPDEPIADYAVRTRDDGLPYDPWLRVHVRAGGRIIRPAENSMTIPGTLSQWREWTGLSFDTAGPVYVPEALVPVQCDPEHGYAVYVEPNVWVHHRLAD